MSVTANLDSKETAPLPPPPPPARMCGRACRVIRTAGEKAGCRWGPGSTEMLWQDSSGSSASQSAHGICAQGSPQITAVWFRVCPRKPHPSLCCGCHRRRDTPFRLGILNAPSNPFSKVFPLSSFEVLKCAWPICRATASATWQGCLLPHTLHPPLGATSQDRGGLYVVLPLTLPVGMAGKPAYPLGDWKSFVLLAHCVICALVSSHGSHWGFLCG